jgi:hypothetical protein
MKQKNTFARYWAAYLLISILLPVFIVEGCRKANTPQPPAKNIFLK